jgi:hypothetical protein
MAHCVPCATRALVNADYRTLIKEHHPDLLPGGERDRATKVAQVLNIAIEAQRAAGTA